MFILVLFGIFVLIGFLSAAHADIKQAHNAIILEEKERKRKIEIELQREHLEQTKRNETRGELNKQLDAVQYQLKLLETLDSFRSADMTDEKEVRKALSLEKQYNALWTKERKLKRELEKLDS